ncbi:MAG: BrnA antitoxin family protein [Rhodocyclales bacterium]|nr:BrnA antitoxin family protein [Rhodocyclales bacterium]
MMKDLNRPHCRSIDSINIWFYKPTKTSTTLRLDSDIPVWLKSQGRGYQTRINAILREAMLKEIGKA